MHSSMNKHVVIYMDILQEFLPMAGLNLNDTLRLASIW